MISELIDSANRSKTLRTNNENRQGQMAEFVSDFDRLSFGTRRGRVDGRPSFGTPRIRRLKQENTPSC